MVFNVYKLRQRTYSVGFLDIDILNTTLVGMFDTEVKSERFIEMAVTKPIKWRNIPEDLDLQQTPL